MTDSVRWWGWLEPAAPRPAEAPTIAVLERALGGPLPVTPPVALDEVELPVPALAEATLERLRDAVGSDRVRTDRVARVEHAAGKGYPDLVRLRSGDLSSAPDAVVYPASGAAVAAALEACSRERIAVVPFGGGTSVVGGVEPLRGTCAGVVTLDLRGLDSLTIDRTSHLAACGAGLTLPRAESLLGRAGLTLGHFPQSFELATVGGCVATRSAGQASTGYGRIDTLVRGLRLRAPAGELDLEATPASAAGPSLRQLVVGSEGALGVITESTLQVRARPTGSRYEGWAFRSFEQGAHAFRALVQAGVAPDVARLSDREETRLTLGMAGRSATSVLGSLYLRARGYRGGSLAIVGFEGGTRDVESRSRRVRALLRKHGGLSLGQAPGESWRRGRYAAPYLRDELLYRGLLAETLETATTWTQLAELHGAVTAAIKGALEARGTPGLVGCHISHLYRTGASLYFTFIARRETGAELDQWRAVKRAASDAIAEHHGTITHHHAVGRDHRPWLEREVGTSGVEVLRAAKERLDPAGIMNPGKLLP